MLIKVEFTSSRMIEVNRSPRYGWLPIFYLCYGDTVFKDSQGWICGAYLLWLWNKRINQCSSSTRTIWITTGIKFVQAIVNTFGSVERKWIHILGVCVNWDIPVIKILTNTSYFHINMVGNSCALWAGFNIFHFGHSLQSIWQKNDKRRDFRGLGD